MRRRLALGAISLAALGGLLDALLLTIQHYRGSVPGCSITQGCEQVLTSEYATFLGVPVSAYGIVFYLVTLILGIYGLSGRPVRRWLLPWAGVAMLITLALLALQAFVINAWCQYCLLSAGLVTIIFVSSRWGLTNKGAESKIERNKREDMDI